MKTKTITKKLAIVVAMLTLILVLLSVVCVFKFVNIASTIVNGMLEANSEKDQKAIEQMKLLFETELNEFDGVFSAEKAQYNNSSGIFSYYFSYNCSSLDDFFPHCVEFCMSVEKKHNTSDNILYFICDDTSYIVLDRVNNIFETNLFVDDYSAIESYDGSCSLVVVTHAMTENQHEHLTLIQNNYSFKIYTRGSSYYFFE